MDTAPNPPQPAAAPPLRPGPASGRVFSTGRQVRSTDVTPAGRLRFDALARYLQDAAEDDVADSGWQEPCGWLLRRCSVTVRGYPAVGEQVALRTFCSAAGPRWAERTTTLAGSAGDLIQACAIWVAVDPESGQPRPLGPGFLAVYGESAGGRAVSARLRHPAPGAAPAGRDWPLRASDFDTAGHVNNSVHWAAVEDLLAGRGWLPAAAEMEYHRPILPGQAARLVSSQAGGELRAWLLDGGQRLASALLTR
jgi:acyl-ACP thioesterase